MIQRDPITIVLLFIFSVGDISFGIIDMTICQAFRVGGVFMYARARARCRLIPLSFYAPLSNFRFRIAIRHICTTMACSYYFSISSSAVHGNCAYSLWLSELRQREKKRVKELESLQMPGIY